MGKNVWGLQVSFFIDLKIASKKCPRFPCFIQLMKTCEKCLIKDNSFAYRRNNNLYQLIGGYLIFKNKVKRRKTKQPKQSGNCLQYLSRMNNLCCKQVKHTKTFQSYRTKETFQIFHNLTCKSENLIYLL